MKTLLVIFGGRSPEHDVSIISALSSVIKPLALSSEYHIEAMYITKEGKWCWDDRFKDIATFRTGDIDKLINGLPTTRLELDGGLHIVKDSSLGRKTRQKIDIVFPVMHGSYGEDGSLMGLLEMAGVPYVGCDVAASALAMDKVLAKQIAESNGLSTGKWVWLSKQDFEESKGAIEGLVQNLSYPLFVKPAHAGSSIGISKVESSAELYIALEVAAHYDTKIIVEEAVQNLTEVTLPIIGNNDPLPALLEQPLAAASDFFDFETKYMNGGKKKGGLKTKGQQGAQGYSNLPAKLPDNLYKKAEMLGLDVYKALGCSGIARVDMLIDSKSNQVYFNEINPMPGSLYAHNWRESGVSGLELVNRLLGFAEEKYNQKQQIQTSFTTSFLKQF